ncbi:MAG: hypothetical protein JXX29_06530 [Deltaproteobacteria bacterium]|nr:hypothetical protein [Deltaproteobacteria bacterium]MBN2671307.1 hypothetical protein [Deltaproteobacteria bacterium]
MKHIIVFALLGSLCTVTACGYQPLLKKRDVPLEAVLDAVENQTPYPHLASSCTAALRSALRSKNVKLLSQTSPRSVRVTVRLFAVTVKSEAIQVVQQQELPVNRRWQLDALVTVRDAEGQAVYGPDVISVTVLSPVPENLSGELALSEYSRKQLVKELAEKVSLLVIQPM